MFKRSRNGDDDVSNGYGAMRSPGLRTHLDCRCLPHGFYPLIPTILTSMALWTSIVQDGCDYGRLEGEESIQKITGSDVFPFLEVGLYHYRTPIFYASENDWKLPFTIECEVYPEGTADTWWLIGKYLTMVAAVLAGSLNFFLWFTTCMTFSIRTWRFCAIESLLAALFRAGSFMFFATSVCQGSGNKCIFAFGSKVDILGIILWVLAAFAILGHYPDPKLRKVMDDAEILNAEEVANLQPKQLMVPGQQARQRGALQARQVSDTSIQQMS